jgi:hypothetical protein
VTNWTHLVPRKTKCLSDNRIINKELHLIRGETFQTFRVKKWPWAGTTDWHGDCWITALRSSVMKICAVLRVVTGVVTLRIASIRTCQVVQQDRMKAVGFFETSYNTQKTGFSITTLCEPRSWHYMNVTQILHICVTFLIRKQKLIFSSYQFTYSHDQWLFC